LDSGVYVGGSVKDLESQYDGEKGKLSTKHAWLWLVEISKTGYDTVRYTSDNAENQILGIGNYIIWGGAAYYACPIHMDDVSASLEGKFPDFKISIGDVDIGGRLRPNLSSAGGYVGGTIRIMVVHSAHLSLTEAAVDETATITGCEVRADEVVFTAGITSKLDKRFPRDRYTPGFCRHKFGGAMCGYGDTTHSFSSNYVNFYSNGTIYVNEGGLVTRLLIYAEGSRRSSIDNTLYTLKYDTCITISGSVNGNDGLYTVLKSVQHDEYNIYVNPVFLDAYNVEQNITRESGGASITITLGYATCDHTLEHCRQRNNLNRFGGSPGVAGGVYA